MAKSTTIKSSLRPKTYQDALKEGEKKRGGITPGNMLDDFKMAIGLKPKTGLFKLQTRRGIDRQRQASKNVGKDIFGRPATDRQSASKGETAAERAARLKREALDKRRAEGQAKRKKFYKEKGERLARLKARLLNLI